MGIPARHEVWGLVHSPGDQTGAGRAGGKWHGNFVGELATHLPQRDAAAATSAKCLFIATPPDQQVEPESPKEFNGLSPEDVSRMEREMDSLSQASC